MNQQVPAHGSGDRGFALLIVLWTLVLLSLLISAMAASGSLHTRQAGDFRRNAQLEAAADGGIDEAMLHLLDPATGRQSGTQTGTEAGAQDGHWFANGAEHRVRHGDVTLSIRLFNESGKINPNRAQAPLLVALLQAVGADQRNAVAIATNIIAWRFPGSAGPDYRAAGRDYLPPGAPFQSIPELGLVLGVTPQLLAALAPHLSLYRDSDPELATADPVVRRALLAVGGIDADNTASAPAPDNGTGQRDESAVTAVVDASDADGHRFRRRAIVTTGNGASGNQGAGDDTGGDRRPFHIMSWEAPGF